MTLATGTCPGTLNNDLVSDYETFRVSEGNRIIHMPKHKRTKYGPAMLGMDPEMQKEMAVFVQKVRPAFANHDEDKLLIKDDGHGFPEGTIGKRVVAFFEKSGVTSTRVDHTHLWKYISTQTYELGDATEGQTVEKVMSHGAVTKQRCNVRTDCTWTASKAMQVIVRVTSSQAKSPSGVGDSSSQPASSIQIPLVDCLSVKVPLDENLKLAITEVFAEELANNKPVSTNEVENRMTLHKTLRPLTSDLSSVKKLT